MDPGAAAAAPDGDDGDYGTRTRLTAASVLCSDRVDDLDDDLDRPTTSPPTFVYWV